MHYKARNPVKEAEEQVLRRKTNTYARAESVQIDPVFMAPNTRLNDIDTTT
jgi:hypothetical protein